MNVQQLVLMIFTLLVLLAMILGLWVAAGLLPWLVSRIRAEALRGRVAEGPGRFLLWLALGGFFTAPLIDLLGALFGGVNLFLSGPDQFVTPWGTTSIFLYYLLSDLLLAAVYAGVLWFSRGLWARDEEPGRLPRLFCALGAASLVNRIISGIPSRVVSLPLPSPIFPQAPGTAGFLVGWVIGLAVLVILLALFRGGALSQEIEDDG